ncbi:unnamed protein product [Dicrocoelium dendriticum]|nr:unnamed protein product [Dicrocoelium dendriticum]
MHQKHGTHVEYTVSSVSVPEYSSLEKQRRCINTNRNTTAHLAVKEHNMFNLCKLLLSFTFLIVYFESVVWISPLIAVEGRRIDADHLKRSAAVSSGDLTADSDYDLVNFSVDQPTDETLDQRFKQRLKQESTAIFEDERALKNIMDQMAAYYLTYGRPR